MKLIAAAASVALFVAAAFALQHILAEVHLADVVTHIRQTPTTSLILALLFTATGYLALTGYDALGLQHLKRSLPYPTIALGSFLSYTFSHNIGLSLLTSGSIRYRIYSAAGLSTEEIVTLTGLCALTFGLGVTMTLGLALTLEPAVLAVADSLPAEANRFAGIAILSGLALYLTWSAIRKKPVTLRNWKVTLPGPRITILQLLLAATDIGLAAATLYVLLPGSVTIGPGAFLGIYVAAISLGIVSHSPGGLGVFETVILLAMPDAPQGPLFGALLLYRGIYYLLPLFVAIILLSAYELRAHWHKILPVASTARKLADTVAPQVIGAAVFAGGAILLFSTATPAIGSRLSLLRDFLPLPFIEASHFLGSIAGLVLMLLARGLFRRLDGAFHITAAVLSGGIIFSLVKGIDYEEALILGIVLAALVSCRPSFYRKSSLRNLSFSPAWLATIAIVIGTAIWLGFFVYKQVPYNDALWWQFAYRGDAPRFLRAGVTIVVLGLSFILLNLLRPGLPMRRTAAVDPLALKSIIARSPRTETNLALTGDKRFLVSDSGDAFIMYQIKGRSWVALGDPVGPVNQWEPLLWQFQELCDRYNGRPIFYQVTASALPLYLDLGLSLLKIGEEAHVDLTKFSLDGPEKKDLRYAVRRAEKEGATFDVIAAPEIHRLLPELRKISDEWLIEKSTHEKGFSVGHFDDEYLANFDCAIVYRDGVIVAFANIWQSPAGGEISFDLMRHRHDTPYGIMDFLIAHLIAWGREHGYSRLNLGMAPLSGLESHALAPFWHRIGNLIYRHGEDFYNFEGLRAYKEKFGPEWSPKYIATPGGLNLPATLFDIAAMVSGGGTRIFRK